jgi:Cu2+-exporting ATPase
MIGAAMMSLSSFSVVTNALRLNLWKLKKITVTPIPCEENADNSGGFGINTTKENKESISMNVTIKVEGMMCPHCEARVKKACESIAGVVSATPSHEKGTVELEMNRDVRSECESAIVDAGYEIV